VKLVSHSVKGFIGFTNLKPVSDCKKLFHDGTIVCLPQITLVTTNAKRPFSLPSDLPTDFTVKLNLELIIKYPFISIPDVA